MGYASDKAKLFLEEIKPLADKYKIDIGIAPYRGILRRGYSDHDLDLTFSNNEKQGEYADFWKDVDFWEKIGYFDLIRSRKKDINGKINDTGKEVRGFFGELEKKGMRVLFLDWINKTGSHATIILTDCREIDLFPAPRMTNPVNEEDILRIS